MRRRALLLAIGLVALLAVLAGGGVWLLGGDGDGRGAAGPVPGGMAADSPLVGPDGLALDADGNLYVSERDGNRVDQIAPDGTMFAVAGKGSAGFSGDGTNGTSAELNGPTGLIASPDGSLTIADSGNDRVRLMGSDGFIETVRGASPPRLDDPIGIALDADGNLVVADARHGRVVRIEPGGTLDAVATGLDRPAYLALDGRDVLVVDAGASQVVRIDPAGAVTTVAGSEAGLEAPSGIALDGHGGAYVSDTGHHRVVRIGRDGTVATVAGTGTAGFSGDGGQATAAELDAPSGLALDGHGNLYIADRGSDRIRRVDGDGVIETVAGSG